MACHIRRETAHCNEWSCSGASLFISDLEMYPLPHYPNMEGRKVKIRRTSEKQKTIIFARPNDLGALPFTKGILNRLLFCAKFCDTGI